MRDPADQAGVERALPWHGRWRARVLGAFLLLVLVVAAGRALETLAAYRTAEAAAVAKHREMAIALAATVETFLDHYARLAASAASVIADAPPSSDLIRRVVDGIRRTHPELDGVLVMDPAGRVLAADAAANLVGRDLSDRAYFRRILEGGSVVQGDLVLSPASGRPGVPMAAASRGADGALRAVVVIGLRAAFLGERLRLRLDDGTAAFVTDRTGRLVVHGAFPDPTWELRDYSRVPPVAEALAGRAAVWNRVASPIDQVVHLGAVVPAPQTGWAVGVRQPIAAALAAARQERDRALAATAGVTVLALALALLLGMSLSRPLSALSAGFAALARGELGHRLPVRGRGEAAWLARRFNDMAARVEGSVRESERAADTLRESQARLGGIIGSAMDAIISVNTEQRVVLFNAAAERMFGTRAAEAIGQPLDRLIPARYRAAHREHVRRFGETGVTSRTMGGASSLVALRANGEEFPIEASISQVEVSGEKIFTVILRDITDRKVAEAELRASEERFRQIAENIREVFWMSESAARRILYVSPGFEEVWGRPRWRLYKDPAVWVEGIHPEDRARAREALLGRALAGGYDETYRVVRPDGTVRWVRDRAFPVRDARGEAYRTVGVAEDITAFKQAETEVRRLNESLERRVVERTSALEAANRELETFNYTVSHDLRAPLRAMRGFSEALLEDYGDRFDETGLDYARRIVGAAERMDEMIRDLLAYSRLGRVEMEAAPVDLGRAIDEALAAAEADIRDAGAEVVVEPPLPGIVGNHTTVVQVVTNLVTNAVKFVEGDRRPRVRVWAEPRDGSVRLWVEDNGIGVPPEHAERIFKVFERLHGAERYPGTGIGLAIVRKGTERMGGRAGLLSTPGRGSRFWVELPAMREAEAVRGTS